MLPMLLRIAGLSMLTALVIGFTTLAISGQAGSPFAILAAFCYFIVLAQAALRLRSRTA